MRQQKDYKDFQGNVHISAKLANVLQFKGTVAPDEIGLKVVW
jgi:hypothetical protein